MRRTIARYTTIKAAPPYCPTRYGKRQMFPNPMAEPAAAMTNPNLLPHCSLCSLIPKNPPYNIKNLKRILTDKTIL
jgi:hypothetical protein